MELAGQKEYSLKYERKYYKVGEGRAAITVRSNPEGIEAELYRKIQQETLDFLDGF